MRLGLRDHKVLAAFVERRALSGHKLSTNGQRVDGYWLGGSRIAEWRGGKIHFNDLGSRSAQSVQRQIKGHAAPMQLADWKGMSAHRSRRDPDGWVSHGARELVLYTDNDPALYRAKDAFLKNMHTKMRKGAYDPVRGVKLWEHYVERAARSYAREYGGVWNKIFPKTDRLEAARHFEAHERGKIQRGEYEEFPPAIEADVELDSPAFAPAALREFQARGFVRRNRWGKFAAYTSHDKRRIRSTSGRAPCACGSQDAYWENTYRDDDDTARTYACQACHAKRRRRR